MICLSCFDGMSCGQIAFERAGIKIDKYYASEIDKYAIQVTMANYPDTVQLGSITEWQSWNIEKPDIIIGGSPCQGFSFAGKQLNFEDERSKLFFVFVDILKHYKPKYFLLENVRMKKESQDIISKYLGVEPIEINSALVSAQNRRRLYWTNIPGIEQPRDKGILLKDIIENGEPQLLKNQGKEISKQYLEKSHSLMARDYKGFGNQEITGIKITGGAFRGRNPENPSDRTAGIDTEQRLEINQTGKSNALTSVSKDSLCIQIGEADIKGTDSIKRVYLIEGKSPCLNTCQGGHHEPKIAIKDNIYKNRAERIYNEKSPTLRSERFGLDATTDNITWRKLTPLECCRLQTVPDDYFKDKNGENIISNSQQYKCLGNGWTVDVIAHIFKNIKEV